MEIFFEKLPRFKSHAMQIIHLIPQWSFANEVSPEAITRQLYIAHAWCDSNPKRAPKKDPARFLWSWMRQAKKYGNLTATPRDTTYREAPTQEDMTVEEMIAIRRQNMPTHRE